jgi:hypothetical protein
MERLNVVRALLACGNYADAIASTEFIVQECEIGSSSCSWEFMCDILFYRIVAVFEHAMSEHQFNSSEQQQGIEHSLDLLNRFMERNPSRREELVSLY